MRTDACCVGIDVAQAQWDMAVRPAGHHGTTPNDADGIVALVARVQALHPTLMVLEATGGLERAATAAWAAAGRPVGVGPPRQVRDCARATGHVATTEAWDAQVWAHCADVLRPAPRAWPDAQPLERRALVGRRQPRISMRTAAQHRLTGAHTSLAQDMTVHRAWLKARLATLEATLETRLRASPRWREHDAL